MTYGKELGAKD